MDISMLSQEAILKEISMTLMQRKKLHHQVSKLESEVCALERTSSVTSAISRHPSAAFASTSASSATASASSSTCTTPVTVPTSFPSPAQQNGFSLPASAHPPAVSTPAPVPAAVAAPTYSVPAPVAPTTSSSRPGSRKPSSSNRRSQEWPDIPEIDKIEEKNPELLAKKILETGRQIEAVKYGTELTPRTSTLHSVAGSEAKSQRSSSAESKSHSRPGSGRGKAANNPVAVPDPPRNAPKAAPMAKLPAGSCMEPPRVNDFEDRLKNIITSVLNENKPMPLPLNTSTGVYMAHMDASGGAPPAHSAPPAHYQAQASHPPPSKHPFAVPKCEPEREGLFARAPLKSNLHTHQPDYTQVSPAKLALRRHLSQEKLPVPHGKAEGYARTIGDLVTGEIERSLEITPVATSPHSANLKAADGRQSSSPLIRPEASDIGPESHPVATSSSHPPQPEESDHVEGLAASLRDRLRNSIGEEPESDEPPAKKKRPSMEASPHPSDAGPSSRDARAPKDAAEAPQTHSRKWQDRISSNFDRLVAFAATEMDKRRRSTESCSPRTEPFSSPRGKEPELNPKDTPNREDPARKLPEAKPSAVDERKDKDKEKEKDKDKSKEKDKNDRKSKEDKSGDKERERSKSSKSRTDSTETKIRDKDKEKDKEHRSKHSSSSGSSSKHERHHERKKHEHGDKKSDGSDRDRDRHKHRDKDKSKESSKSKDRHRDKDKERERKEGKSGAESVKNKEAKEAESEAQKLPGDSPTSVAPLAPPAEILNPEAVKREEPEADDKTDPQASDGHHHFKKRMAHSRIDQERESDGKNETEAKDVTPPSVTSALSSHSAEPVAEKRAEPNPTPPEADEPALSKFRPKGKDFDRSHPPATENPTNPPPAPVATHKQTSQPPQQQQQAQHPPSGYSKSMSRYNSSAPQASGYAGNKIPQGHGSMYPHMAQPPPPPPPGPPSYAQSAYAPPPPPAQQQAPPPPTHYGGQQPFQPPTNSRSANSAAFGHYGDGKFLN